MVIVLIVMKIKIPDIYKQLYPESTFSVLESRYSTLGPMWVNHQMEWNNGNYASFKDHDKYLILIFLVKKSFDFYSRNFIKLSYEEFYSKETVEIEKFNITEISIALNIPKESARRKLIELQKIGAIRKTKKKIIIDRSKFSYYKPVNSIKRICRFFAILSDMCVDEKILLERISSEELDAVITKNFSYVWNIYYELQIPMMTSYKKIFNDLESFHIWGTCTVNQHLHARNESINHMDRNNFIEKVYEADKMQGLNAMSISDITGIPRATVIRKLKKLVTLKYLSIDNKKQYKLTGSLTKILLPIQKNILTKLAYFSTQVFNLHLLNKKD